jgi:C-terminal processing protease CtpA/Prc
MYPQWRRTVPVVHAIKDTSVLGDRVRVGDRLLAVDGEDCTAMHDGYYAGVQLNN